MKNMIRPVRKAIMHYALFIMHYSLFIMHFIFCLALTSCVDVDEYDDTPQGNFEALWHIIDEHYCFFAEKQQLYGVDWDAIYNKYKVRANDNSLTSQQLFEVLTDMLAELRDGHVNLTTAYDYGRYWAWQENYPANVSDTLLRRYLGTDYHIAAGLYYRVLDDNIGYVRYGSFLSPIGDGNIDEVLSHMLFCRGLIIDIRGNGGGDLTNAELLAAHFCNEKTLVGYLRHKTGKGHDDFSAMEPRYIEPSNGIRWQKRVCLLTNRQVFSAANEFAVYMSAMPRVTIVGDHTGGGAGMPFNNSLPNGWNVRFSAVPMYDAQQRAAEDGIEPDVRVDLTDADFARGEDTIIETARKLLAQ